MTEFDFSTRPPSSIPNAAILDRPIWSALTTRHRDLALTAHTGNSLARSYPAEIGPLCALAEQAEPAYNQLRALSAHRLTAQFLDEPWQPQPGWTLVRDGLMDQMIWTEEFAVHHSLPPNATMRELADQDAPEMLALARLTEPGPFGTQTHTLGRFFGIFEHGVLVAMAGQRLHLPGFTEVSAVCTHPGARGRGYSRVLTAQVMADILSRGEHPFLHVFSANTPAIRAYCSLGFTFRRNFHLAALRVAATSPES